MALSPSLLRFTTTCSLRFRHIPPQTARCLRVLFFDFCRSQLGWVLLRRQAYRGSEEESGQCLVEDTAGIITAPALVVCVIIGHNEVAVFDACAWPKSHWNCAVSLPAPRSGDVGSDGAADGCGPRSCPPACCVMQCTPGGSWRAPPRSERSRAMGRPSIRVG